MNHEPHFEDPNIWIIVVWAIVILGILLAILQGGLGYPGSTYS